jgi:hypothetical protein
MKGLIQMTQVGPGVVRGSVDAPVGTRFVEWGAVLAGAVLVAALSFVFLTFGSAIGLSTTSPWTDSGVSVKTLATIAVFFAMVQQIGSFMAGGYIAGRMRSRWGETNKDEVEFRDGLHGGLVWAVGVAIGAALLLTTAGSVVKTGADVAGKAAAAAAANADPSAYSIDALLRPAAGRPPVAGQAATPAPSAADTRAEVVRICGKATASGTLPENNKSYLASVVAQRTGLPQPEAEKRVTEAFAEANRAVKEAADKARRASILTGFVTAASLMISFGAAWWAALRGGNHRDNQVPARFAIPVQRRRS